MSPSFLEKPAKKLTQSFNRLNLQVILKSNWNMFFCRRVKFLEWGRKTALWLVTSWKRIFSGVGRRAWRPRYGYVAMTVLCRLTSTRTSVCRQSWSCPGYCRCTNPRARTSTSTMSTATAATAADPYSLSASPTTIVLGVKSTKYQSTVTHSLFS